MKAAVYACCALGLLLVLHLRSNGSLDEHAIQGERVKIVRLPQLDTLSRLDSAKAIGVPPKQLHIVIALFKGPADLPSEADEEHCITDLLATCTALGAVDCFPTTYRSNVLCQRCFADWDSKYIKHKHNFILGIKRAVPHLRALGWSNITVVTVDDPAARQAFQKADVIISFARVALQYGTKSPGLLQLYRQARFILIDTTDWSSLYELIDPFIDNPRILAVLKHSILNPIDLNNGPLDKRSGAAHMTYIKGFPTKQRVIPLSNRALEKMTPLIPQVFAWRYPLDFAGKIQHARLAGFFRKDANLWPVKPFQERKFDVSLMGATRYKYSPEITMHKEMAAAALSDMAQRHKELQIYSKAEALTYPDYLKLLLDTKVFLSPYGMGEWSFRDFEAVMCGCVVVKPEPAKVIAYPNIYQDGVIMVGVHVDFSNLELVVLRALADTKKSESMIAAAQALLREYGDAKHYAADLDRFLGKLLE